MLINRIIRKVKSLKIFNPKFGKYYFKFINRSVYISPSIRQLNALKNEILDRDNIYKYIFDFLKTDNDVILDVGGNIGYSSLVFSIAHPQARIFAFEPDLENRFVFNFNTRKAKNVYLLPFGCSDSVDEISFGFPNYIENYNDKDRKINTGLITAVKNKQINNTHKNIVVPIDSFNNILNKNSSILLVKIDVEGFEKHVLKGANIIFSNRAIISLEYNHQYKDEFSLEDINDICIKNKYSMTVRSDLNESNIQNNLKIADLILFPEEIEVNDLLKKIGYDEIIFNENDT